MSSNHQYPPAPAPGDGRPRAKSSFSFRSNHSRKSSGSGAKIDLHESHAEKQSKRLTTKADPSMALSEAEPSADAAEMSTSLAPIRAIQHRDAQGNPIADPDRSNPTRSRWERPLDTIRSFEAAIDGGYSSRKSYIRSDSDGPANYNRRGSYYSGTQVGADERPRYSQNSYYGRSQSYRPESYIDGRSNGMTRPDSYYQNVDNGAGPSNGYYPNRARYPRTASEPQFNNGQGVYPMPGNQQSYETVTTASGSGNSDQIGYSTDPSSENSSMDRVAPLPTKEPGESYGFNGFGGSPEILPVGTGLQDQYSPEYSQQQNYTYQNQGRPQVPRKESTINRVPIKLGASSGNAVPDSKRPAAGEKRKSWFGKRFSKA